MQTLCSVTPDVFHESILWSELRNSLTKGADAQRFCNCFGFSGGKSTNQPRDRLSGSRNVMVAASRKSRLQQSYITFRISRVPVIQRSVEPASFSRIAWLVP